MKIDKEDDDDDDDSMADRLLRRRLFCSKDVLIDETDIGLPNRKRR